MFDGGIAKGIALYEWRIYDQDRTMDLFLALGLWMF